MISCSKFEHKNEKSPFRYSELISGDYEVFINGEAVPVYTCRISKMPFNRPWPGHQREINQTEIASFVNIVSDEKVDIEIVMHKAHKSVMLKPFSKGIKPAEKDGRYVFSLENEGHFVFCGDDMHNCLYIFNSKPIECKKPEDVTYYFGPGVHMPGKITLKDNESVYVDKDALVFGCLFAEGAKNIRVFGNGLFDDIGEERFFVHCYEPYPVGNLKFYNCEDVKVEGVLFRNSAMWCINIFECKNVVLDNIKVFGQWRYNADGVDIVNSIDVILKNSFIHSFDDSVTLKGVDRHINTNVENILTENCVLWCDWGRALEVGLETACREFKNIIFRNCDILRSTSVALDIQHGDCSEISDVVFENINVEYNSFDTHPQLQKDDDSVYDVPDEPHFPNLLVINNNRFRNEFYANAPWLIPLQHAPVDLTGIEQACVHDVTVRNINVYGDDKLRRDDGKLDLRINIYSALPDVTFRNIAVSNVSVNGKRVKADDIDISVKDTENFTFE